MNNYGMTFLVMGTLILSIYLMAVGLLSMITGKVYGVTKSQNWMVQDKLKNVRPYGAIHVFLGAACLVGYLYLQGQLGEVFGMLAMTGILAGVFLKFWFIKNLM